MMLREGLTGGLSSPPYYYPSPQQRHLHHPDFNMPFPPLASLTASRLGMGHPPPHGLPGSGGLFSLGEIPSPGTSFQMSMVDTSTPTNINPRGGGMPSRSFRGGAGDVTGIRDLNNFLPVHKIKLDDFPNRLFTVENTVTRETIVVVTSTQKIQLFILKIKSEDEAKSPSEKFEFSKFHELTLHPNDLEGFVISQNCSITLVPFKLTYALSTRSGKNVYVYDQGSSNEVPDKLNIGDTAENSSLHEYIYPLQHDYPVTNLAIDSEKDFLACVQELGTIIVWDIGDRERRRLADFRIPNQCVHISFHKSEPYVLMVIDANGWARFFNVFRQCCFRSIHLVHSPVFSAEWSLSNPSIFAAGFAETFAIIDTCKVLSSNNKCYEVPELIINRIKINPNDDKVCATLSRLTGTIQLWRDNFGTHIWKHRNAHVNDIAWVHGFPYLLALGHQALYIYDSSVS